MKTLLRALSLVRHLRCLAMGTFCLLFSLSAMPALLAADDILFEDFEGPDWGAWTTTGTAFNQGPVKQSDAQPYQGLFGLVGQQGVNSHALVPGTISFERNSAIGELISPTFTVSRDYIHFLIGGSNRVYFTGIRLLDANTDEILRTAQGGGKSWMRQEVWNVSDLIGRAVKIRIEDKYHRGQVCCDHIVFSDQPSIKLPGFWSTERWVNIFAFDVSDLVMHDSFFGAPNVKDRNASATYQVVPTYSGTRVRGYITAPETGYYTFWLSASTSGELWLSSDESKYRKQRLAHFGGATGAGSAGVNYNSGNLWDMYSAQMSEEVYLVAGETYFLEALTQQHHVFAGRHVSVAWARPGQDRELIPSDYFTSYAQEGEDADDDYLPDSWEIQYGLDATDNGLVDRPRQGERGDFDADGLSNREEFVLGTDPSNPDTDGDGLLDSDEVNSYGTNPTQSDAPSELVVGNVDLASYLNSNLTWSLTSQGLIASSFRGDITWDFTVPSSGYWSINALTTLLGDLYLQEIVDFEISINGVVFERKSIPYGTDGKAMLRVLTPLLSAGTHTLSINIDNLVARRMVSFQSIQILEPQGADLDGDGHPDWVNSQLTGVNSLFPYQAMSRTSPAFLEGQARVRASASLNGQSVLAGVGDQHWYASLPLSSTGSTAFTLALGDGITETGSIQWQATNVMTDSDLIIRKGDALKLIAQPSTGATGQSVTLTVSAAPNQTPVVYQLSSDADTQIHTFSTSGVYHVTADHGSGVSEAFDVIVKQADFSTTPKDLVSNTVSSLSFPSSLLSTGLYFDGGEALSINQNATVTNEGLALQVSPIARGQYHLVARLFEGGPILGVQPLNLIGFADVIQTGQQSTFFSRDFAGYLQLQAPIVATDLPAGGTVVVKIFRSGLTFLDGTRTLTLSVNDFVNGVYYLDFLFPIGMSGGYCHYIDIYDRNGAFVTRR